MRLCVCGGGAGVAINALRTLPVTLSGGEHAFAVHIFLKRCRARRLLFVNISRVRSVAGSLHTMSEATINMIMGREPWRHGVQPIGVQQHRQTWYGVVCSVLVLSSCNQSSGVARITRTVFTAGVGIETTERAVHGPPSGWRTRTTSSSPCKPAATLVATRWIRAAPPLRRTACSIRSTEPDCPCG